MEKLYREKSNFSGVQGHPAEAILKHSKPLSFYLRIVDLIGSDLYLAEYTRACEN